MTTYTGHVEPDGPWHDRLDGHVHIRKMSVESQDNNVYVVTCTRTSRSLVIDAAARPERIRQAIAGTEPLAVVQTHGHWDHVRAWEALRADPGLPVWGHEADAELFPLPVDRPLLDGDTLSVGELVVEVIHIPAHTEGSLLYVVHGAERTHLFSGDTLFPGGHGRTTTAVDHTRIMDGLEAKVFDRLADSTWVYPGHGGDTTLGRERPELGVWRKRGW